MMGRTFALCLMLAFTYIGLSPPYAHTVGDYIIRVLCLAFVLGMAWDEWGRWRERKEDQHE